MIKKNLFIFGGSKGIGSVFTKLMLQKGLYNIYLFARTNPNNFKVNFNSVDFCKQGEFKKTLSDSARDVKVHHLVYFLKYRGGADNAFMGEIEVELETIKNSINTLDSYLQDGASIVFVSSVCGSLVAKNQPVEYHLVKAAMEQIARFYAVSLGGRNIRVNVVAPSLTIKPENQEFYRQQVDLCALYSSICPLGRMGKSEDICEVIEFLLDVSFMTGQVLRVDGGLSLQEYEGLARRLAAYYSGNDLQIDIKGENMNNQNSSGGGGNYLTNCIPCLRKVA